MKNLRPLAAAVLLAALLAGCSHPHPVDAAIEAQRNQLTDEPPSSSAAAEEEYTSPVDFAALQAVNPDICAWLDIPGTAISYPILQRAGDDAFYLDHGENSQPSAAGALFIEGCNAPDFTDPAIAVYGHHMRSGAYFGNLQDAFETAEGFAALRELRVYLPDKQLRFAVFAAVPYNSTHLLKAYQFGNPYEYYDFIDRICAVRGFSAQVDGQLVPEFGDRLLILSTCLKGDNTRRYLVIGKAVEEEP